MHFTTSDRLLTLGKLTIAAAIVLDEADESAWEEVKPYLEKMSPYDFQDRVAALMDGGSSSEVTKAALRSNGEAT